MSHEIQFTQDALSVQQISQVVRLDRGDPPRRNVNHLFYNDADVWQWGDGDYMASPVFFGEVHPGAWAYLFQFSDGTTGTCRVSAINAALAALGARVV